MKQDALLRTGAAIVGFTAMVIGIGLISVPLSLTVGGVVILCISILGEMRAN